MNEYRGALDHERLVRARPWQISVADLLRASSQIGLVLLFAFFAIAAHAINLDDFTATTLKEITELQRREIHSMVPDEQAPFYFITPSPRSVIAEYTGKTRLISEGRLEFLKAYSAKLKGPDLLALYKREMLVKESGSEYWIMVQESLMEHFAKELKPGDRFVAYLRMAGRADAANIILTMVAFTADPSEVESFNKPKSGTEAKTGASGISSKEPCSCGGSEMHNGIDNSALPGTAVPVSDDGVVVAVEDAVGPNAGACGRFVVVKHEYHNGRVVYTRYALLGRIVGDNGKSIRVGAKLKKDETLGVLGPSGFFHLEVRPVVEKAKSPGGKSGARGQAKDKAPEWLAHEAVDPTPFDFDDFGGKGKKPAAAKKKTK